MRPAHLPGLPIFSVDTEEEARLLLTMACPTDYEGHHYSREVAELPPGYTDDQRVDAFVRFGRRLADLYQRVLKKKSKGGSE